ncbi:ABC transporter ATP-binding protein [Bacillus sp. V2I10]|uniref:ABC transporter ATP-binding protein n=1 Tax=Bacillus sp. V2I10 TaxID=3042276 RepID=UPI00278565FC|nr:ABC transporter ATP-binding protein [Bacillus sp. V2I10]MDQ0857713.1 ATP-binding cassette subfamily B protein AbcA/BmrA [Bacillus sp. V2I10]
MSLQKTGSSWRVFFQLIRNTKPSKTRMAIAGTLSVLSTVVGLVIPLFTKNLIDDFSFDNFGSVHIFLLISAFIAQAITSGVSIYLLNHVGQHVVARLRERLWKKHIHLPVRFYDDHKTGEMISRMTNDTAILKGLITDHITNFFTGIIAIIGSFGILLYLDWQMTLIMLALIPLSILILLPLGRKMYKVSKGLQDETAGFTALLSEVLSHVRLVKSSNAEHREYSSGKSGVGRLFQFGLAEAKIHAWIGPLISLVIMSLLVVILGYGGLRVQAGVLSSGDLVAFILYLFQIVIPMTQFTAFFTQLQKAMGASERIIEILEEDEENLHSGKEVENIHQSIRFKEIDFAYKKEEQILNKVTLEIKRGQTTAIVGPSGSGKTTLFSLVERYYLPTGGGIFLGDEQIDSFTLASWREQIGYVSQESPIISGTIKENICYGLTREVTDAEIAKAAKMAYADQFIEEYPDGYNTQVGERGVKLSGGQRQRIGIARALIRDPKILLLDEATSSLDSHSEIVVQKALGNLMAGRTTIVIAHRLSTVIDADQIIFLDKGRVTGTGTHSELLESHPMYREFAVQQLKLNDIRLNGTVWF